MKVSSKTTYALKTLVDLASRNETKPTRTADIAERQGIPPRFLEQILLLLKGAGIVQSVRGARGGYLLASDPASISVADVSRLTEDSIFARDAAGLRLSQRDVVDVALDEVWHTINTSIEETLTEITVKDLCTRARKLQSAHAPDYAI